MESSVMASSSVPPTPGSTPRSRLVSRPSALSSQLSPSSAGGHTVHGDRFIPCRARSNLALFDLDTPPVQSPYCALLSTALFSPAMPDRVASSATVCSSSSAESPIGTPGSGNIFRFKAEAPGSAKRALFADGDEDPLLATKGARPRKIPRSPYKILDAPEMRDDFYRNLLDWSSHDVLAVGLGNCINLWNASRGKIWDVIHCKRTRTMEGHSMREVLLFGILPWFRLAAVTRASFTMMSVLKKILLAN